MLQNETKTRQQLVNELVMLRQRVAELEASEAEHMKAQQEVDRLLKTMETAKEAICISSIDGEITYTNSAMDELFGYQRGGLVGRYVTVLNAVSAPEAVTKEVIDILEKNGWWEGELYNKRQDGTEFISYARISALRDKDSNIISFLLTQHDITEQKQVKESLKESEERYRSLVRNVKLGILRSMPGPPGRILEANPAMEEITGYSREELLQIDISKLYVNIEERAILLKELVSATGKVVKQLRWRKKDGTEIVVLDTVVTIRDEVGKVLYFDSIIEDITERKRAEEKEKELQQELYLASRLAAIGGLAAGVAHEINNPLTGILGFSQRLLRKSTDDKLSQDLAKIYSEAQRAAKVVQNLLTFARCHEPRKQHADINDVLQKALELRAYQLKTSNMEVALDLAPSLPKIMVDFHQIQEVFLNIILNAEQAMSEANGGGRLSIRTQWSKDYITISFADDGPGIPVEHLAKLFNPFFTTRGKRGGTGLGLSICHGIVAEHGGKIYAKSKPGKGATFFVELPVATEKTRG
jgi:PAS domain S-box-containing protein